MQSTRTKVLVALAIVLVAALGAWWYFGFSLGFMRFFAAEPGVTDSNVTPTFSPRDAVATGTRVVCTPDTQTVAVGALANFSATGGNNVYEWFSPDGSRVGGVVIGSDGFARGYSAVYSTPGIKKVTVQSPRGDGTASIDSMACAVIVTP